MSSLNHTIIVWEDVLVQLRRTSVSWKGISLSDRDVRTYTEALVYTALHLTDMSSRHGGFGNQRELVAWTKLMVSLDVFDVGACFSDVISNLRHVDSPITYNWFKRQLSRDYPFVGAVLAPIRRVLEEFLSSPNPRGFYLCYQSVSFITHLSFVDLPIDQEAEYIETEKYLRSLRYEPSMLKGMNLIMREWMKEFSLTEENFRPHHGPGSIAEKFDKTRPLSKYQFLGTDALIDYVFTKFGGIDVVSFFAQPPCKTWVRVSKLVSVPKSMKTRRTISKEPATLMFLQQGVSSALMDYVHGHSYLRDHIDFRWQDLNGDLAISSSKTGSFATIDLSSASDTVTTRLVKAVFRGTPLYPFLVALRSHSTELFSGKVMRVEKFAPMGSALCFPIETLIFACAVEYAVRRAQRTHLGFFPEFRVYGDDIIVRDPLFGDVTLVLEALGFKLNISKSFSTPNRFRESCGGEGYDGIRVTPLKISRKFSSLGEKGLTSHHAATYEGFVSLANSAYEYNFPLLRAWIIRDLLRCPVGPPLFSGTTDNALYSPWPDNYQAAHRFNSKWQVSQIRVAQVRSAPISESKSDTLERFRYFETLRLSVKRVGDMFLPEHRISVLRGTLPARIRAVWVERPPLS